MYVLEFLAKQLSVIEYRLIEPGRKRCFEGTIA